MKAVDIVILIEHVDRELDVACLLKAKLREIRPDLEVLVANFYTEARDLIANVDPRLVVMPFLYGVDDIVMRDYVAAWHRSQFLNLAWEQILYGTQQALKRPRDAFVRDRVHHLTWSEWYADYLREHGVMPDNIHWLGHMLYDLYDPRYRSYYTDRQRLARRFGLDPEKRWVFFPENFRWAFIADQKLQEMANRGAELEELRAQHRFCIEALTASAEWLNAAAATKQIEVIFRPRPAVNTTLIREFLSDRNIEPVANFHIVKEESVREWILASDMVISSNSTSLIEAAIVGRPIYRVEPVEMPACLRYEWCDLVPSICGRLRMLAATLGDMDHSGAERVRAWAEENFRVGKEPIAEVARLMAMLVDRARTNRRIQSALPEATGPAWLRLVASLAPLKTRHKLRERFQPGYFFSYATHEKDLFGQTEVARRTQRWIRTIGKASHARQSHAS